jgi:hypothetical protein
MVSTYDVSLCNLVSSGNLGYQKFVFSLLPNEKQCISTTGGTVKMAEGLFPCAKPFSIRRSKTPFISKGIVMAVKVLARSFP